jgi:caa(3)-type oxidase subunit IV
MDQDTLMVITFWIITGSFIGGVVTPVIAASKRANEWVLMLIGLVAGAVGNVISLVPLWLVLTRQAPRDDTAPRWQRDALSAVDVRTMTGDMTAGEQVQSLVAQAVLHFWPQARPTGEHSHRSTYASVFAALVMLTVIEVLISVGDLGFEPTVPLVVLSSSKVMLVALFFMHLRYDHRWYSWIFAFSFPFALIVLVVLAVSQ